MLTPARPASESEGTMHVFMRSIFAGTVCCAIVLAGVASAAPAPRSSGAMPPTPNLVRVDARCGHGWHYVPAGYARHGKWRDAHCSRN